MLADGFPTKRLLHIFSCVMFVAACSPLDTSEQDHGSRAANVFVATLMYNAHHNQHLARAVLRTFHDKKEPLPYLPDFVLPEYVGKVEKEKRVVAHVGCGQATVHPYFLGPEWKEIRIDISAENKPDIVADMSEVRTHLEDASVDAVYCAHSLEHLTAEEASVAIRSFWHILKPGGVLLATVPDMQAALSLLLSHGATAPVYHLAEEGVTPLDLIFGHQLSVASGNGFMRHQMGWTEATLKDALLLAAFSQVQTFREFAKHFNYVDLWALAHKEQHQPAQQLQQLQHSLVHPQPTRSDAPVAAVAAVAPSVAHVAVGTWNFFVQNAGGTFKSCVRQCAERRLQPLRQQQQQQQQQDASKMKAIQSVYHCACDCKLLSSREKSPG